MSLHLRPLATALTLLAFAAPALSAAGDPLKPRDARRLAKQAGHHLEAGRLGAAADAYRQVVDAGDTAVRDEALYGIALAHLLPSAPVRDDAAAGAWLRELGERYPRHPRATEAAALGAVLADLMAERAAQRTASAARDELAESLDRRLAQCDEELALRHERHATAVEELSGRLDAVEAELARSRSRLAESERALAAAHDELAQKDAALAKLKEAVIGN